MKSIILLFAILVCATARINLTEVFYGFTTELGFNDSQYKHLNSCIAEYHNITNNVTLNETAQFLLANNSEHREILKNLTQTVQFGFPACKNFIKSLVPLFSNYNITRDEQNVTQARLVQFRLKKYSGEVFSVLGAFYRAMSVIRSDNAGKSLANLVLLLTGVRHNEAVFEHYQNRVNLTRNVNLTRDVNSTRDNETAIVDTDEFIQDVITRLLGEFKYDIEIPVEKIKEIREVAQRLILSLFSAEVKMASTSSVVEREVILVAAVRDFTIDAKIVIENLRNLAQYVKNDNTCKMNKQLLWFKGMTISDMARAFFRRLPNMQKTYFDFLMGLRTHKPKATSNAALKMIFSASNFGDFMEDENFC